MPRITILNNVLNRSLADCLPYPLVESARQIKNRLNRFPVLLERLRQDQTEESADWFMSLALHVDGAGEQFQIHTTYSLNLNEWSLIMNAESLQLFNADTDEANHFPVWILPLVQKRGEELDHFFLQNFWVARRSWKRMTP